VFWDEKFVDLAKKIYDYRFEITDFLANSIINIKESFS
jgi:recombinational DNA repair ATPase RecF